MAKFEIPSEPVEAEKVKPVGLPESFVGDEKAKEMIEKN